MTTATNAQVQNYVDQYVRPISERMRDLQILCAAAKANLNDVYANLTASNPSTTWTDGNTSNPPHLLSPSDVLAWNTFITGVLSMFGGDGNAGNMNGAVGQYPIIQQACVRAPQV